MPGATAGASSSPPEASSPSERARPYGPMSEERPGSAAGEAAMKVALLTREYPPDVYGGAGVLGADAVIAVSEGMRRDILESYPGVDPARVQVIHNGIDASVYRPEWSEETLRRHGVDPATPYAIFVGRVTRQKGLSHLLEAAA